MGSRQRAGLRQFGAMAWNSVPASAPTMTPLRRRVTTLRLLPHRAAQLLRVEGSIEEMPRFLAPRALAFWLIKYQPGRKISLRVGFRVHCWRPQSRPTQNPDTTHSRGLDELGV